MLPAVAAGKTGSGRTLRGSMDPGTPLLILAVLGGAVLYHWWPSLPAWAAGLAVAAIAVAGVFGVVLLRHSGGMAANWERTERDRTRKQDGPQDL